MDKKFIMLVLSDPNGNTMILSKFPFVSFQFRKGHYNFCKSG